MIPIEHRADVFELLFHNLDIVESAVLGMNARLYGVILRGQSECVEPHRLKDVLALHYLITGKTVRQTVIVPMPDMQLAAAGITEHLQHIVLVVYVVGVELVNVAFTPKSVPLLLYCDFVHNNLFDIYSQIVSQCKPNVNKKRAVVCAVEFRHTRRLLLFKCRFLSLFNNFGRNIPIIAEYHKKIFIKKWQYFCIKVLNCVKFCVIIIPNNIKEESL